MNANVIGFIIGAILILITILLIFWGNKKDNARIHSINQAAPAPSMPQKAAASAVPVPNRVDDLTLIEGIGPKIASLLKQQGITTFAQLAATEVTFLEKLLKDNNLQFAKPTSWPEQAVLAADGKFDELKALQDKLIGGR